MNGNIIQINVIQGFIIQERKMNEQRFISRKISTGFHSTCIAYFDSSGTKTVVVVVLAPNSNGN